MNRAGLTRLFTRPLARLIGALAVAVAAGVAVPAFAADAAPGAAPGAATASGAAPGAQAGAPGGVAVPTDHDPVTSRREVDLAMQLRCLVCQNQSIAESNAELALDLRRQIREQIAQGRTDEQIVTFMTDRYGDFVLYRPPFKPITLVLWVGPLLLLLVGVFVARRVVRGRATTPAAPLDEADRALAERLLAGQPPALAKEAAAGPAPAAAKHATAARSKKK